MPTIIVHFQPSLYQHAAKHEHRHDLGDLADALHDHADVGVDADTFGEEAIDHDEVAIVDQRYR
jgi:hypothetical protein